MKQEVTIKIECKDQLEAGVAKMNLQKLADRLTGKGINKFMAMYEKEKEMVEGFLKMNGI